jgi:hypothetical protein
MISSVSNSAPVSQYHLQQPQQASHPAKARKAEPHDTVVLSDKAKAAAADPDHDGD